MHRKSDSDVTSPAASSPSRSPRRPIYYVMSPSDPHHNLAYSLNSTPATSPSHHLRYSTVGGFYGWKKVGEEVEEDESEKEEVVGGGVDPRCYVAWFLVGFVVLFLVFVGILCGASKAFRPKVVIKKMTIWSFNVQAGTDFTGVPTKLLSLNSTVRLSFHNPATFFGVHVLSTPLTIHHMSLPLASGEMVPFYQSRKTNKVVTVEVGGALVPLYGGGNGVEEEGVVDMRLGFVVRWRAHVLGEIVKSKFYASVWCEFGFEEKIVGVHVNVTKDCHYHNY